MATPTITLQAASMAVNNLMRTLQNIVDAMVLLNRLDTKIPTIKSQRATTVRVASVVILTDTLPNGSGTPVRVTAKTGDRGQYDTHISFHPRQGLRCTCPDLQQRKVACKHVAALANEVRARFTAISDLLDSDVERLSIQLTELESAVTTLTTKAESALTDSLKALES